LKIGKLFVAEIAVLSAVVLLVVSFAEFAPYLWSSRSQGKIGLYEEREFLRGNLMLAVGESMIVNFSYPTYDPAILVFKISFLDLEMPGYFTLLCNYRTLATVFVDSGDSDFSFTGISFSGRDWVEPVSGMSGLSEITFQSESKDGFAGRFDYQINARGSR